MADQLADVRALLFDTFGTVVDWREGVARDATPFLKRHGIACDPHDFANGWRTRYQPAMEPIRKGLRPYTRLDVLHRESLESLLAALGADVANIPEAELDDLNRAWHRLDPWPDSVPGLTRLKRRFIIAPHSNGNIALLTNMAKRAGIPWDCILGAEIAQAYKPAPESYLRVADALGLRPEQCMMVAAHNGDLSAARAVGLRTAFVARPREHGPGQKTDLAAEEAWDASVRSFEELASTFAL